MSDSVIQKKKMEISEKISNEDWHPSTKFSRPQILGMVYAFHKFLENKIHQPHSRECMDRLNELLVDNPKWGKKYCLDSLIWKEISDTTKAMWRKLHKPTHNRKQ